MKTLLLPFIVCTATLLTSCGGSSNSTSNPYEYKKVTPNNVKAIYSNNDIQVKWSPVDNAGGYHVYYSLTSPVTKADNKEKVFSHYSGINFTSGITEGVTYFFAVSSHDIGGGLESDLSKEVSVFVPDSPPYIKKISQGLKGVDLTWNPASSATSYNIYHYINSSFEKTTTGVVINSSTANTFTVPNIPNGETFYFALSLIDITGVESGLGRKTGFTAWTSGSNTKPPAPKDVKLECYFSGYPKLSWTPVGGLNYKVYYSETTPVTTASPYFSTATPSYFEFSSKAAKLPNKTYYFSVVAIDGTYQSDLSPEKNCTFD